jgi:hypothetical protein
MLHRGGTDLSFDRFGKMLAQSGHGNFRATWLLLRPSAGPLSAFSSEPLGDMAIKDPFECCQGRCFGVGLVKKIYIPPADEGVRRGRLHAASSVFDKALVQFLTHGVAWGNFRKRSYPGLVIGYCVQNT